MELKLNCNVLAHILICFKSQRNGFADPLEKKRTTTYYYEKLFYLLGYLHNWNVGSEQL